MILSKAQCWRCAKISGRWTWLIVVAAVMMVVNGVVFLVEVFIALADDDSEGIDPTGQHNLHTHDIDLTPQPGETYVKDAFRPLHDRERP